MDDVDFMISPLFQLGTVIEATVAERRYSEILEDAGQLPPGLRVVARNTLVPTLDDATIEAIDRLHASVPSAIAIRSLGGAFGRVPADATAFAHRDAEAMVFGMLMLPSTAPDAAVGQALVPWQAVADRGSGTYVNFQGSATATDVAAAYPPATYSRLAAVKREYDPGNRFARNHNIEPR
jgi:FAD/FMN-containing dehydrogenase